MGESHGRSGSSHLQHMLIKNDHQVTSPNLSESARIEGYQPMRFNAMRSGELGESANQSGRVGVV